MPDRWFRLDGNGSWGGSGRTLSGQLAPDDLSLVFDAGRNQVTMHPSGKVIDADVFTVLSDLLDGDPETYWVGWFGYAARPDLPIRRLPGLPDAVWMRPSRVEFGSGPPAQQVVFPPRSEVAAPPQWYRSAFERVASAIGDGSVDEINLTFGVPIHSEHEPTVLYDRLRAANPASYAALVRHHDTWLLSSSPECFLTVDADRAVTTRPIKGTLPRGADEAEDEVLRARLRSEPKFAEEHLTTLPAARDELAAVCEAGSVTVVESMGVETLPSVHQLVSTVTGRLRDDVDVVRAAGALLPPASMTGVPKAAAIDLIDAVEPEARGPYSGALGWISGDGRADLGVVIRSLFGTGDRTWTAGTGGGITAGSVLTQEWVEAAWKVDRLRAAAGGS